MTRTEPASLGKLLFQEPSPSAPLGSSNLLPGNSIPYKKWPSIQTPLFSVKIVPYDLLSHVEGTKLPPFPPSTLPSQLARFDPEGKTIRYRSKMDKPNVVYASILVVASKAKVHQHAVVRRTIMRRIREAIRLIVVRGAGASVDKQKLLFDSVEANEEIWLARGYSYVFFPQLEAFRAPWPVLIGTMREVLRKLKSGVEVLSGKQPSPKVVKPAGQTFSRPPTRRKEQLGTTSATSRKQQSFAPNPSMPGRQGQARVSMKKSSRPSSDRAFSTTSHVLRSDWYRRRNQRAEVVLGTHKHELIYIPGEEGDGDTLPAYLECLDDDFIDIPQSVQPGEEGFVALEDLVHDEDAEGWVIGGPVLPLGDLAIPELVDSPEAARFYVPKLPHHAGKGYDRNVRTIWKDKDEDFIEAKRNQAVIERKKNRKRIRAHWNDIDLSFIHELRRREETRLEYTKKWASTGLKMSSEAAQPVSAWLSTFANHSPFDRNASMSRLRTGPSQKESSQLSQEDEATLAMQELESERRLRQRWSDRDEDGSSQ